MLHRRLRDAALVRENATARVVSDIGGDRLVFNSHPDQTERSSVEFFLRHPTEKVSKPGVRKAAASAKRIPAFGVQGFQNFQPLTK